MSSKVFAKQSAHGGIEIQSDSHGDTLTLFPHVVDKVMGVSMVDMTEDSPVLVIYIGDQSLEVPFAGRTNIRRAYDQTISLLTKK